MRRRQPSFRKWPALLIVALLVGGLALWWQLSERTPSTPTAAQTVSLRSAEIERRDLIETESFTGSLGYAESRAIYAGRSGVITTRPDEGVELSFGAKIFSIDQEPLVLVQGKFPAYRELTTTSRNGPDIQQLESYLAKLGYDLKVDQEFTSATATAVEKWERKLGRSNPNGTVARGDIYFAETSLQLGDFVADIGTPVQPSTKVVQVSSTNRVVTVNLAADRASQLSRGDTVSLELSTGPKSPGEITEIGTESQTNAGPDGQSAGTTVPITITVSKPEVARGLNSASVEIRVEKSRTKNALVVPVNALLALVEGGYAVQLASGSTPGEYRLIGVTVGKVTDDFAAITSPDLRPGMKVAVPS